MYIQNSNLNLDTFHSFNSHESLEISRSSNTIAKVESTSIARDVLSSLMQRVSQSSNLSIEQSYSESESLTFNISGTITTKEQKQNINVSLELSRSFVTKNKIDVGSIFTDPLVININGEMPDVKDERFSFDIDADGEIDQISQLKNGNYFLSFDKNKNGLIDDGSELFGAKSGDGFAELMQFDDDKNGWIDENDAIYENLRLWSNNDGRKRLLALGEVGIGAIYLGGVEGNYTFKNSENNSLANMKKLSFGVGNHGRVSIVSQIDFAKFHQAEISHESIEPKESKNGLFDLSMLEKKLDIKSDSEDFKSILEKRIENIEQNIKKIKAKLHRAKTQMEQEALRGQINILQSLIVSLESFKT